ncbi:MAG: proline--tRNA ligase [Candidatus Omnitrophica bacterium]|nr:proline--tRNA ligase [Candidatus Omnitrophota bacterium]
MLWSRSFIPTLKESPQEAETISHRLMLRAGLVRLLMAGVYSYLPLGLKVLTNIERIIREELDKRGANEVLLPALQPQELWIKTGRDKEIGEVMIRFVDRRGRRLCLGPTHEEVITDLVKNYLNSYKQLPIILYQIQTKFRDEIRPRFGLVRACEFIMKDAYSFDQDEEGLEKSYQLMHQAYVSIFRRCGLDFLTVEADPGVMGGKVSHEFMVPAKDGEDVILVCPRCKLSRGYQEDKPQQSCPKCGINLEKNNAIEIGHIFKLGTKYSQALEVSFIDPQGRQRPVIMGCYGIGVSRLIPAIIEQHHDSEGIIWPKEISPYKVIILALDVMDKKIMELSFRLHKELEDTSIETLFDDRNESAGVKFKDADLLGIMLQIVVGKEYLKNGNIELRIRETKEKILEKKENVIARIKKILYG